jgi:hypothetical protein
MIAFTRPAFTKKPPKAKVSDAEFRRRLKNIAQWRKHRLAEFRAVEKKLLDLIHAPK